MLTVNFYCCCFIIFSLIQIGLSVPKKYDGSTDNSTGGFLPSTGTYYRSQQQETLSGEITPPAVVNSGEPRALVIESKKTSLNDSESASDRVQRFGLTGYGGAGGYGGTGSSVTPGLYAPLKIDLGGVVLGALIGLGAVIIFPKLTHIFSSGYGGGYGGYARSTEATLTELMANFETALEKYNIDSSSCMQRLVCTTVQNARINMSTGNPSSVDQWVEILTTNPLFASMLDGTAIKEAVDAGWGSDQNACNNYYPKCTINKQKVLQMVSNILPST